MTDELDLDAIEDAPTERLPGDFVRVKGSGAPRVLRADGSGKRDTYGRPSSLYVGNTFGLDRWKEQQLLVGLQLMLDRDERIDGPPDKTIKRALELAEASLAAERGTAVHEFIDPLHNLRDVHHAERDFVAQLDRLGFSPEFVEACRLAYARALERYGFELLTTEAKCIIDEWRVAGSADAFMRCHDVLTFDDGGVIPAGEVVCEDHKTGGLKIVSGRPVHWLHYSAQIAAYARSMHYVIDGEEEWREPWPWAVNQRSGLILHFDVLGALDTDVMTVRPIRVDLVRGRELGEHAVRGRELERTTRAFGFHKEAPVVATVDTPGPSLLEQQLADSLVAVAAVKLVDEVRFWLQERIDTIGAHAGARADLALRWPPTLAPLSKAHDHTDDDLACIESLCDDVEAAHTLPFGRSRPGATNGTAASWVARLTTVFPGSTITDKEQS